MLAFRHSCRCCPNFHINTSGDLEICVEGPSLSMFDATPAIELWWKNSTARRVNQKPRATEAQDEYEETSSEEAESTSFLDDWDD